MYYKCSFSKLTSGTYSDHRVQFPTFYSDVFLLVLKNVFLSNPCFETFSDAGPSSSTAPSNPLGNDKQKTSKARFSKSAVASLDRGQEQNAQRTKAWSSCSSKNISKRPETGTAASENTVAPRPVSTYGRHTDAESRYTPTAWFNFKEAKSVGVIDAFACDANNVRPLCYKVDKSQTKGVPRLLRHRLAVRVGQNGVVRNAGADTSNSVECGGDVDRAQEEPPRGGAQKQRVAPLSWEEQVNWKNVRMRVGVVYQITTMLRTF